MGVKRLNGAARANAGLPSASLRVASQIVAADAEEARAGEIVPHGAIIYVDAYGLMFSVVETHEELAGTYAEYEAFLLEHIAWLQRDGRTVVKIVFDGKNKTALKDDTKYQRRREREMQWARLFTFTHAADGVFTPDRYAGMEGDVMLSTGYDCVVNEHGLQVIHADGEAELEIAARVRIDNAGGERAYAYGNDSDFMAIAACPYITLGDFFETTGEGVLRAKRIWRRTETAALFGVSEAMFVEICIAYGNDFTSSKSIDRELVFASPTRQLSSIIYSDNVPFNDVAATFLEINTQLLQMGANPLLLKSLDADIEERLQYSRLFYGNGFREEPMAAWAAGEDEEEEEEEELAWLTYAQKDVLRAKFDEDFPRDAAGNFPSSPPTTALILGQAAVDFIISSPDALNSNERVSSDHAVVMRSMLELLNDETRSDELVQLRSRIVRPKWNDMVAAIRYQQVANEMVEWFGYLSAHKPTLIYDGVVFHALMLQRRPLEPASLLPAVVNAIRGNTGILDLPQLAAAFADPSNSVDNVLLGVTKKRVCALMDKLLTAEETLTPELLTRDVREMQAHLCEYLVLAHAGNGANPSVLVFVSKGDHMKTLRSQLAQYNQLSIVVVTGNEPNYFELLPTLGEVPADKQARVILMERDFKFDAAHDQSATIPHVGCVIDFGHRWNAATRKLHFASQNLSNMRLARSGRLGAIPRYLLVPHNHLRLSDFQKEANNRFVKLGNYQRGRDAVIDLLAGFFRVPRPTFMSRYMVPATQQPPDQSVIKLVNEDLAREVVTRGGEFRLNFQDGARWFNMDYQPRGGALVRVEVVYDGAAILEIGEEVRAALQYGVTNAHLYNEQLLAAAAAAAAAQPAPLLLPISQFEQMNLSDGSGGGGGGTSPGRQQRLLVVSRTSSLSRQPSVSSVAEEDEDDEQEGEEEEEEEVVETESQAALAEKDQAAAGGGVGGKRPILVGIPLPPRPPRSAASGGGGSGGISPWRSHRELEYDRLGPHERQQLHHLTVAMKYDPHTLDRQPGDEEVDDKVDSRNYEEDDEQDDRLDRRAMTLKGKYHKGREKAKMGKKKGYYHD